MRKKAIYILVIVLILSLAYSVRTASSSGIVREVRVLPNESILVCRKVKEAKVTLNTFYHCREHK